MANIFRTGGVSTMRYALNEEKWTGNYWIDGKKIYRKILSVFSTADVQTDLSDLNIDTLVYIDGIGRDANNETSARWRMSTVSGVGDHPRHLYIMNNLLRNIGGTYIEYVIIEYTKTTEGSEL